MPGGLAPPNFAGPKAAWFETAFELLCCVTAGLLVATLVLSDGAWARSLSLQWLAPWLRGEAPPLLSLLVLAALAALILCFTALRVWMPPPGVRMLSVLLVATQLVGFNIGNLEPLKFALLGACLLCLLQCLAQGRTLAIHGPQLMLWLVMLAFALASTVNGLTASLIAQYSIVAKFLMFFVLAQMVRTPEQLLFAVRLVVALGLASALLALAQEALFYWGGLAWSLEDNASKYWFKETPLGWMIRATGFHPTAQNLSHYLLVALACLWMGPFTVRARCWGGLLMMAGIFFTFSGNALMLMVAVALLAPIMWWPQRALHYCAGVALSGTLLVWSGAWGWLYARYLLPLSGKSAEDRIALLQAGLDVVERHPWVGIGLNNFGRVSTQPVHNAYFQMATEIGLMPALLLCLLLVLVGLRLGLGVARTRHPALRQAGLGLWLAWAVVCVHFMFEPFINSLVSWAVIGLAEAAALLLYRPMPRLARPASQGVAYE